MNDLRLLALSKYLTDTDWYCVRGRVL